MRCIFRGINDATSESCVCVCVWIIVFIVYILSSLTIWGILFMNEGKVGNVYIHLWTEMERERLIMTFACETDHFEFKLASRNINQEIWWSRDGSEINREENININVTKYSGQGVCEKMARALWNQIFSRSGMGKIFFKYSIQMQKQVRIMNIKYQNHFA